MALKHGKSYVVRKNEGSRKIYRGGVEVGEFPEVGYTVQVFGDSTGLTGTLLAAHAYAEVALDVAPHNRRFVLTAEEYDEHKAVLERSSAELMERFPYLPEEAKAVEEHYAKYADITERGEANVRRKMMNLSPYQNVTWNPNPLPRPVLEEADPEPAAGPCP